MQIRFCKNWLSILAEQEVPQRTNCQWCDEFMINYDMDIIMDMGCAVYDVVYVTNSL